jgi:hypothetical protein
MAEIGEGFIHVGYKKIPQIAFLELATLSKTLSIEDARGR